MTGKDRILTGNGLMEKTRNRYENFVRKPKDK
jgi:hypothetical protein